MRNVLLVVIALSVFACVGSTPTDESSTGIHGLPPPTPAISAATQVRSTAGGVLVLDVSATVRNATTQRIQVAIGASCPLYVNVFEDPTSEYRASADGSMACPAGVSMIDLAPGDSTVLTRTLGADEFVSRAPGTYGVNIAVNTSTLVIGAWAGVIQLPLTKSQ